MSITLDQLLSFESRLHPTNFKTKEGLLLWPVLRYPLFRYINDFSSNFESLKTQRSLGIKSLRLLLKAVVLQNGFKFLFVPNLKFLYFGSGVTNVRNEEGKYYNRVSDDLLLLAEKESYIIEQYNTYDFKYPRIHKQHAASVSFEIIYIFLIKSGLIRVNAQEATQISSIIHSARKTFNQLSDKDANELDKLLTKQLLKAKAQYFLFSRLFNLKKPQIIFVEDAAYGTNSYVVKAAKDRGIKVGEIQHGFVGKGHMAYNYADNVAQSTDYQQYLPDYFLTYGNFWSEEINLPSKKVAIGKPSIQINASKESSKVNQSQILFVSSGNTYQETKRVLHIIMNGLRDSDTKLIFRPHPLEMNVEEKYSELLSLGMYIDQNTNVYDSIRESQCIIGDISTVLYEALAFANKTVISYRSAQNPQVTFPDKAVTIVDIEDLNQIQVLLKVKRNDASSTEDVWSKDWQNNFKKFIESL
ncbi:hypothetical protein [Pontibacter lucknowensis]|uniref:CDP-Glycerol:Poly(Glycerophosphate) glycerophosphotransferase n=1 Tax=Pontibacter lucknowensis TaxID=1077936 RepID=A0A1N7ATI4_9BACT|nr:hypothetical protein [Pontibacter lucknowensis]SIR42323.1 hypothetical protein SAMN05421545_3561 [Pontibacter lucknowensis]